jgi:hypothetical protein
MRRRMFVVIALMLLFAVFPSSYTAKPVTVVDIAVISVTPSTNTAVQGQVLEINVTTENQGNVALSGFNVTAYANTNKIGEHYVKPNEKLSEGEVLSIIFEWNTTGYAAGGYTISANADVLPDEIDTADNTYTDGVVTINVHDVAITSVKPRPTSVFKGALVGIEVVVENEGTLSENFEVTAYYDNKRIDSTTLTMPSGASWTVYLIWFTGTVTPGTYTIKANASTVPGETDTVDNTKIDGTVTVTSPPGGATGGPVVPFFDII